MNRSDESDGPNRHERILAVDIRPRWFGFAVLNRRMHLLDFGLVRVASNHRGQMNFIRLVKTFRPRLVVIRRARDWRGTRPLGHSILRLSRRFSIQVEHVSERQLRTYFNSLGIRNKQERASFLARQFPELSWKVPPPRKRWQHEHQNMPIFDALATSVAHFQSNKSA